MILIVLIFPLKGFLRTIDHLLRIAFHHLVCTKDYKDYKLASNIVFKLQYLDRIIYRYSECLAMHYCVSLGLTMFKVIHSKS